MAPKQQQDYYYREIFLSLGALEDLRINSLTREKRCCRSLNFGSDFRSQPPPEALSVQSLFWLENNCTFHLRECPLSKTAKLSPPSCNLICCPRSVVVVGGRCNTHSRFNCGIQKETVLPNTGPPQVSDSTVAVSFSACVCVCPSSSLFPFLSLSPFPC